MILDTLNHALFYRGLHPRLVRGLDYLSSTHLASLPTGRHEIDGDHLFAIVDRYTTRPRERCRLEAHRRYHDIQYIVEGEEAIGYAPLRQVRETDPYNTDRDIAFFTGPFDLLTLHPGTFAIFAPHDAHAPQIASPAPSAVLKVVLKVAASP